MERKRKKDRTGKKRNKGRQEIERELREKSQSYPKWSNEEDSTHKPRSGTAETEFGRGEIKATQPSETKVPKPLATPST